jgi:hypothetical protein
LNVAADDLLDRMLDAIEAIIGHINALPIEVQDAVFEAVSRDTNKYSNHLQKDYSND